MRAPGGLHLDYQSLAEYQSANQRDVLGVATFNGAARALSAAGLDIPVAEVSTPVLSASSHIYEVWRYGEEAQSGQHEHVHYRRAGDMLFGCIAVSEASVRAGGGGPDSA